MFDGVFIASIIGSCVQVVKEALEPTIPLEKKATHPKPHRNPETGKIVIENCKLYYEDISKYGGHQAQQWVEQGKYNLSSEEFGKEKERIKAKYERLLNI